MWRTVKLGEVCEIQPPKKQVKARLSEDSEISFMPMDKLGIGDMYPKAHDTKTLKQVYSSYTYFENNDVLLAKITPCFENGKLGIANNLINGVGFGSSEFVVLRCSEKLLPQFLYYHLSCPKFRYEGERNMSGAVGHKRVQKDFIENNEISLPPLAEQQRIVAKLDAAFAEIDEGSNFIKHQKDNLNKLQRRFLEKFFNVNFSIKKLAEIEGVKSGGTPKSSENTYWEGDIEWFSSGELNSMYISSSQKKITQAGLKNSNAKLFPKGSLLIGIYDTAAMKMSILQNDATFNQAIVGIPPNTQFSSEYLLYALNYLKPEILLERRGVRQQNLSLAKIKDIAVPMPSEIQQQEIVSELDKAYENISNLLLIYENKAKLLNALKSAILAQELQSEVA